MKQSNETLGYIYPIQKKLSEGRFKIAFAKTKPPYSRSTVRVRTHKLDQHTWNIEKVTLVKNYNEVNDSLTNKLKEEDTFQ